MKGRTLGTGDFVAAVRTYREALRLHQTTVDRLNVYPVPDGDTGTNMALTLAAVCEELDKLDVGELDGASSDGDGLDGDSAAVRAAVCKAVSHGALMGARGNSGVIVSQLLRGLAATLSPAEDDDAAPVIDADLLAEGLTAASVAADGAVMRPVEGTILSVARAAARAAAAALGQSSAQAAAGQSSAAVAHSSDRAEPLVAMLEHARREGQAALEATPTQLAVLADAGVVDAGAAGFLLMIDALLHVADGRPLPDEVDLPPEVAAVIAHGNAQASAVSAPAADPTAERTAQNRAELHSHLEDGHGSHDVSETRYEVMFLLDAPDENIDAFKVAWDGLGDSIVMVGGDGLWNCHIHTDDIGPVIEAGITAGRPHRIEITDLHEQVAGLGGHGDAHGTLQPDSEPAVVSAQPAQEQVTCAVVAVSPAAGIDELFAALGVQQLVTGGQTMNPSVAELLTAVEAAPSAQIVVLPNNSNIVPVARRLDANSEKTVRVVATKSVPAGLAALLAYDAGADAEANSESMAEAAGSVTAGEVTQAVRDTMSPDGPVAAGEWIGLDAEGISASAPNAAGATTALLASLLGPAHEIVTLIEGVGASAAETAEVTEWLAGNWPSVEVELHHGGQDHYRYLVGLE